VREHVLEGSIADFVPVRDELTTDHKDGESKDIGLHDGSIIRLHKGTNGFDVSDPMSAINALHEHKKKGEILTGLLYCDPTFRDMHDILNTTDTSLNMLDEKTLCPGQHVLEGINNGFRWSQWSNDVRLIPLANLDSPVDIVYGVVSGQQDDGEWTI